MSSLSSHSSRAEIQREVDRIVAENVSAEDLWVPASAGAIEDDVAVPFGTWLLSQKPASESMFLLVECAKRDPQFPKNGDPEAVRTRLRSCMAEGDLFDAVDEAELDWVSY